MTEITTTKHHSFQKAKKQNRWQTPFLYQKACCYIVPSSPTPKRLSRATVKNFVDCHVVGFLWRHWLALNLNSWFVLERHSMQGWSGRRPSVTKVRSSHTLKENIFFFKRGKKVGDTHHNTPQKCCPILTSLTLKKINVVCCGHRTWLHEGGRNVTEHSTPPKNNKCAAINKIYISSHLHFS